MVPAHLPEKTNRWQQQQRSCHKQVVFFTQSVAMGLCFDIKSPHPACFALHIFVTLNRIH